MTTGWPRELEVCRWEPVAEGVVLLEFRDPADAPLAPWEPGAHLDLHTGAAGVRQYSLCGEPSDRYRYRIAVLLEPAGRGGSRWVHETVRVGDLVTVAAVRNNFRLAEAPEFLLVAGGVGITPILPMIDSLAARGRPWQLLYGGRTRTSMAFADDLANRYGAKVALRPQDSSGLLDVEGFLSGAPPGTAVYACGPEPLLRAAEDACATRPELSLHLERFRSSERHDGDPSGAFEVELARSGEVIGVGPDESILDALERRGHSLPNSCREGVCGTCETRVLSGEIEHRDDVLDEAERKAGDVMMICVSRCRGERLVLDL